MAERDASHRHYIHLCSSQAECCGESGEPQGGHLTGSINVALGTELRSVNVSLIVTSSSGSNAAQ